MAMLRTRLLARGYWVAALDGPQPRAVVAATVPAGYRAIVRDIRIFVGSQGSATDKIGIYVRWLSGSTQVVSYLLRGPVDAHGMLVGTMDVVLEAGDALVAFTGYTNMTWYISGALMPLAESPAP